MRMPPGTGWVMRNLGTFWRPNHRLILVWPGRPDVSDSFPQFSFVNCPTPKLVAFIRHQKLLMESAVMLGDYRQLLKQYLIAHPNFNVKDERVKVDPGVMVGFTF